MMNVVVTLSSSEDNSSCDTKLERISSVVSAILYTHKYRKSRVHYSPHHNVPALHTSHCASTAHITPCQHCTHHTVPALHTSHCASTAHITPCQHCTHHTVPALHTSHCASTAHIKPCQHCTHHTVNIVLSVGGTEVFLLVDTLHVHTRPIQSTCVEKSLSTNLKSSILRGHIVFSSGGTERPHCVLIWRYREATLCSHLEVQRGHIVFSSGGTERPHCVLIWRYREATLCSHLEVQRGHIVFSS